MSTKQGKGGAKGKLVKKLSGQNNDTLSAIGLLEKTNSKGKTASDRNAAAKPTSSMRKINLKSQEKSENDLSENSDRTSNSPVGLSESVINGQISSEEYEGNENDLENEEELDHLENLDYIGDSLIEPVSYAFDPESTEAVYYVGSAGNIINRGIISDPEFLIPSCSPSEHSRSRTEYAGEDYWETEEDEEYADIQRYSSYFIETEQSLTDAECEEIREGLEFITRTSVVHRHGFRFQTLDMSERQLHDLSMVEHFNSLKSLNVSRNFLRNVRALGSMLHLVKLDASNNEIKEFLDIYSDQSLPLREVNFSRNKVEKILDLKPFWALTVVNLSYNKLTVIDGFQTCIYLRVLNLSYNDITEINNLACPNLVILLLKFNKLTTIENIEDCGNLRYLNISNNQINELKSLKALPELMELRCQENKIEDLLELEHLKVLIHLSHLCLQPNPCMDVGMSRSLLVHMLPQVRYLDGVQVTPDEILEAKNTFDPSFTKLAFEDHTNTMLEKAFQSSNKVFDEFCKVHPIPPIILLVGSSKSKSKELALYLKEKLRHEVLLGGVHSTATSIEGLSMPDIPVSYDGFLEMKNRGEFLAISHILGRICGFASSQIARAAERGSILVATVPLVTAICIRRWKFRPKYVLILPSDPPHFNVDQFIRSQIDNEKGQNDKVENTNNNDDTKIEQLEKGESHSRNLHLVSFAANGKSENARHTIESATKFLNPAAILKQSLASNASGNPYLEDSTLLNRSSSGAFEIEDTALAPEVKIKIGQEYFPDPNAMELPPESTVLDQVLNVVEQFEEEESNYEDSFKEEELGEEEDKDLYSHPIYSRHPLHVMKETPPFTVSNRLRRLRRLASILLIQAGEKNHSEYIPDILMNLPVIQPLESEALNSIDWKKTILQNRLYNSILETDEAYYMVLTQTTTTDGKPEPKATLRSTLIPHRVALPFDNMLTIENRLMSENESNYYPDPKDGGNEIGIKSDNYQLLYVKDESESENSAHSFMLKESATLVHNVESDQLALDDKRSTNSTVVFSELNLEELRSNKGRRSDAELIAEKIRSRKKTGFSHNVMPSVVSFSEFNLTHLQAEKERGRRSDAETISSKIIKRKRTAFVPRVLTPEGSVSNEYIRLTADEEDESEEYIVNQYMNYEDEANHQFDEFGTLIENTSSSDNLPEPPPLQDKTRRFKHRDAIELSILKTREEYHKYHLENPGFFSAVLDTADLQKSEEALEEIAREMLRDFQIQLKNIGQYMDTHAGLNKADEELFIKERAEFLNWCNHEWNKGYQHPLQHMSDKYGVDNECRMFFESKCRADNISDSTLPRHNSSARVRQLILAGQHQRTRRPKKSLAVENTQVVHQADEEDPDESEFEDYIESLLNVENDEATETSAEDTQEEAFSDEDESNEQLNDFNNEFEFEGEFEQDDNSPQI